MGGSRGGQGVRTPPEKSQNIGVVSDTGLDPPTIYKATKPASNVGPSSARQRNAISIISMAFRWRADDGPFIAVFVPSIPLSTKKLYQIWTPSEKLSSSAHARLIMGELKTTPIKAMEEVTTISPLAKRKDAKALMQANKYQYLAV